MDMLERLDRMEQMLRRLCAQAGIEVEQNLRAFITSERGLAWWDVEETKARAVGFDPLDAFELGNKVLFYLMGWTRMKVVEMEKEPEPKPVEPTPVEPTPSMGQYL
jgi:hypothetical protein